MSKGGVWSSRRGFRQPEGLIDGIQQGLAELSKHLCCEGDSWAAGKKVEKSLKKGLTVRQTFRILALPCEEQGGQKASEKVKKKT